MTAFHISLKNQVRKACCKQLNCFIVLVLYSLDAESVQIIKLSYIFHTAHAGSGRAKLHVTYLSASIR